MAGDRGKWRLWPAGAAWWGGGAGVAAILLLAAPAPLHPAAPATADRQQAFDRWRAENPDGARDAARFELFLRQAGVADVVPLAGLLAGDSELAARTHGRCEAPDFAVPPAQLWPNMVPVLRAVRAYVIPAVGPVQVVSGWREPAFNACVGGARNSHHTRFAAVDLVTVDASPAPHSMNRLCAMWRASPVSARIGFGAYLDPERPELNRRGRFHIDVRGKRTWGFGYRSPASWCNLHSG